MTPRCSICLIRHHESEECVEAGEEGYLTMPMILDAFRMGDKVCLRCQSILFMPKDEESDECPICLIPWERFEDDDLEGVMP